MISEPVKKLNLDLKEHRKALIFGIFIGIVGFFLYKNGFLQDDHVSTSEEFFSCIVFTIPCVYMGLLSGFTIFVNKNILGIFLPFLIFIVHAYLFGDIDGGRFEEGLLHIFFLVISTLSTLLMFLIVGIAVKYINDGK